jgi:hypothetical protein
MAQVRVRSGEITIAVFIGPSESAIRPCHTDAPHHINDIICDKQRAASVNGDAHRAAHRIAVLSDEACEDFPAGTGPKQAQRKARRRLSRISIASTIEERPAPAAV